MDRDVTHKLAVKSARSSRDADNETSPPIGWGL